MYTSYILSLLNDILINVYFDCHTPIDAELLGGCGLVRTAYKRTGTMIPLVAGGGTKPTMLIGRCAHQYVIKYSLHS